jgi:aspartate/methionine/tyrosine aminotransferase
MNLSGLIPRQKKDRFIAARRRFVFLVMNTYEAQTGKEATVNLWPDVPEDADSRDFERFLYAYAGAAIVPKNGLLKDVRHWRKMLANKRKQEPPEAGDSS